MFFRVNIPGYGNIYVQAPDQQTALAAAQRYLNQNGITVETGAGNPTVTPTSGGSIAPGSTIIGADSQPYSAPGVGGGGTGGGAGNPGNKPPGNASPLPDNPPAGGGGGTGGTGGGGNGLYGDAEPFGNEGLGGTLDEVAPLSAFLRGAQARTGLNLLAPRTLADRIVASRGFDFLQPFRLQELLSGFGDPGFGIEGRDPTGQESRFEQYSGGRNILGARQDAFDNLAALFGNTASAPMGGPLEQLALNPNASARSNLVQNAEGALASRISPLALSLIDLPDADQLYDSYIARTGGGTPEPGYSFLEELRRRYGLDRIGL